MSNENRTFIADYEGCEISVLALNHENGWVIEVSVSGNNFDLPTWRDHDNCYKDIEDAKSAGMKWAKARIDEYIGGRQ